MNQSALPLRILANATFGSGPERPSRAGPHVELAKPQATANMRNIIEGEIVRIIEDQPAPGESVQRAFDRRERELRALFLSLTRVECLELQATLLMARDASAGVLTNERRSRVLASLAEIARSKGSGK